MQTETHRLELKVCERCGGLWLRPQASGWRYCQRCKPKVDRLPTPRRLDHRPLECVPAGVAL